MLRSQTKLIRRSRVPIRECSVRIEPNLATICLQWLRRGDAARAGPSGPSNGGNAGSSSGGPSNATNATNAIHVAQVGHAGHARTAPTIQRRSSIASCRNIFDIDGTVGEVGFDFLRQNVQPLQRQQLPAQPIPMIPINNAIISSIPSNNAGPAASSATISATSATNDEDDDSETDDDEVNDDMLLNDLYDSDASDVLYSDEENMDDIEPIEPANSNRSDTSEYI